MDLTGLRAERPFTGKFDDFFIHPILESISDNELEQSIQIDNSQKSFETFTTPNTKSLIFGPPGAGKSTWTKWLQRESIGTKWIGLCIRVELRRFSTGPLLSLNDLIRDAVGIHFIEDLTSTKINEWIRNRNLFIVLDGFDEIRPDERDRIFDWINELISKAQKCPIILTSRPITTDHLIKPGNDWKRWNILRFNNEQIINYMERWYSHVPIISNSDRNVNCKKLADIWMADSSIEPLTSNPLLLSTLLMVNHLDGRLPSGRSELYKRYISGMLDLWDDRRHVFARNIQLSIEQKRHLLHGLAIYMFLIGQEQIDKQSIFSWLDKFIGKMNIKQTPDTILDMFVERTGLVNGPGIYEFVHKNIEDYLIAEAILEGDQLDDSGYRIDQSMLFIKRVDDSWNSIMFFWAGLAPIIDVELLVDKCIKHNEWGLSLGLLFDQYERLSKDAIRRYLLLIINKPKFCKNDWWANPGPNEMITIPTINLTLRSLGDYDTHGLTNFLQRAIQDSILLGSDYFNSNEQIRIRNLLWLSFVTNTNNSISWESIIKSPPNGQLSQNEFFLVIDWVISRISDGRLSLDLKSTIITFQKTYPKYIFLIPIALLSIIVQKLRAPSEIEPVSQIMKIISEMTFNLDEIPSKWLLGTEFWVLQSRTAPRRQKVTIDLLLEFKRLVNDFADQGLLIRDSSFSRSMELAKLLKKQRNFLKVMKNQKKTEEEKRNDNNHPPKEISKLRD
jgi:hypothetical protein